MDEILSELLEADIAFDRYAASVTRDIDKLLAALLAALVAEMLKRNLAPVTAAGFASLARNQAALFAAASPRINETFAAAEAATQEAMRQAAELEAARLAASMNRRLGGERVKAAMEAEAARRMAAMVPIQGATTNDWWMKQSEDLRFRFQSIVTRGIQGGLSIEAIAAQLRGTVAARAGGGLIAVNQRAAQTLVRSAVAAAVNEARLAVYSDNRDLVRAIVWASILDGVTTVICRMRHNHLYTLEGRPLGHSLPWLGGPGRAHWNCRSSALPVLRGEQPPRAPGFKEWFTSISESEQNRILGKNRAEMFLRGKITQSDLLDQSGRPITLAELKKKLGSFE